MDKIHKIKKKNVLNWSAQIPHPEPIENFGADDKFLDQPLFATK